MNDFPRYIELCYDSDSELISILFRGPIFNETFRSVFSHRTVDWCISFFKYDNRLIFLESRKGESIVPTRIKRMRH